MAVQKLNGSTREVAKSSNDGNAENSYWCKPVDEVFTPLWFKTATKDRLKAGCASKVAEDVGVAIQELDAEGLLLAAYSSDAGALVAMDGFGAAALAGGASVPSSGRSRYPGPTGNTKPAAALTKLALVRNILSFDAELGTSPTMFRADFKDGEFGEEHFVITVTDTDDSSNKSEPSDSIIGAIRSELGICGEKGLFLEDTSSLKTFNQDGNGFFPPAADGTLEAHLEIRDLLRFNTAERDRSRFVRAFYIQFENLHWLVFLVLKCDPDNSPPHSLTGTMANRTILQPACVRSRSFPREVIRQPSLTHYPANHAGSRL